MIDLVDRAARGELGDGAITAAVQSWGGDDFAWFTRQVPGTWAE